MIYWRLLLRAGIVEHLIPIRNAPFKMLRVHIFDHCATKRIVFIELSAASEIETLS